MRPAAPLLGEVITRSRNLDLGGDKGSALHRLSTLMAICGCRWRVICRWRSRRRGRRSHRSGRPRNAEAGAQGAVVARVAVPARLHRRGALGVGRLIGGESSSEIDRRVFGSIGSGVAKGFWRHVTTALRQGVGKDLGVPPRDVALIVAAPGAVVLEVKSNVGATKARRRRWTPIRWRSTVVVAPA